MLGGEPLWHVAGDLAIFVLALHPAKKMLQRAAPGNDPSATHLPRLFDSVPTGPVSIQNAGTFAGAARFHVFRRHPG